jgi:8-oxo-dGTP diphosphatase
MPRMHVCTGLLERDGRVLVVGNQYPNHTGLLWNLPGGRQERNETVAMAVARELLEETGLTVQVGGLAYVAESFDTATDTHVVVFCFTITSAGEPCVQDADDYVRACRFVAYDELPDLLGVRVIREPLLGHLADRSQRYFGYLDAGVTIAFADDAAARAATPPDADDRAPRRRDGHE